MMLKRFVFLLFIAGPLLIGYRAEALTPDRQEYGKANFETLQALLDTGGKILLKPKTYFVMFPSDGRNLEIRRHNTTLEGTKGKTKIIFYRESWTKSNGRLRSNGINGITIKGIHFQGALKEGYFHRRQGKNVYSRRIRGVEIKGGRDIRIEDSVFCTFDNHNLAVNRRATPISWVIGNKKNSPESLNYLANRYLAENVIVRHNRFRHPNAINSTLALFGVKNAVIENNQFEIDNGAYAILLDDASQATPLEDYAININVTLKNNTGPASRIRVDGTTTAEVVGNTFKKIKVRSYDFDQQLCTMAPLALRPTSWPGCVKKNLSYKESEPLWHLENFDRKITLRQNKVDEIEIRTGGEVKLEDNSSLNADPQTKIIRQPNCASDEWAKDKACDQ